MQGHGTHRSIGTGTGVKRGITAAVGIEPGEVGARQSVSGNTATHTGKVATDQNLAVALHHDRAHRVVKPKISTGVAINGVAAGIKACVQRAIAVKSRQVLKIGPRRGYPCVLATHQNLAVTLHCQCKVTGGQGLKTPGHKTGIKTAVGVQARQLVACRAIDGAEVTRHQRLAIRLDSKHGNTAGDFQPWCKAGIGQRCSRHHHAPGKKQAQYKKFCDPV
ncbi:hypothetical protein GALL_400240 [mine drainage metagenome]|uniref:Uncharacterized protein n=1 Tax=mine drainage metagenome TaxID=410659 RepID=A0A1J5Q4Q4_9ZZZZ